jgi:acyl-CoA reductase-like NAD-dependent aldehyde dehydrogenase
MDAKLLIDGRWVDCEDSIEVKNKFNGKTIGTVPKAGTRDIEDAIAAADRGRARMAGLTALERSEILLRAVEQIKKRRTELARTIAAEAGKALKFSLGEADRAVQVFTLAAEETKQPHGETLPLDAVPNGKGYFGFWTRRPVGVVAAITPFNFPLNLVAHKVAPAIASGNSIVLKPATQTPLTAVKLCEILQEAGLPDGGINLVIGPGSVVGDPMVGDPRVGKVSFTGSREVGAHIVAKAGIKKVTLELGNTAPVIIGPDADLAFAAQRCALGAHANSGQICISVQRIYGHGDIHERLSEQVVKATEDLVVGDPLDEKTDVGPMIDEREVARAASWVDEARAQGARVLTGGKREGTVYLPTILDALKPDMKVMAQEVFAPVAAVVPCDGFEDALRQANDSDYGLQAAVFTRDIDRVLKAIKNLDFGGVIINDAPIFRADHMPYGGNRQSGLGREGVRFAMEDMTNIQMVAIRQG